MRAKLIPVLLLWTATSAKAEVYGMNPVPTSDKPQGATLEVTNLPPVMSQDTLGICFAYASSTLLTTENCRKLKEDCTHISENKVFSPLHLAKYGRSETSGKGSAGVNATDEVGGSTANVLQLVAYEKGQAAAEDCASLDKVLSKVGGSREASEMQLKIWDDLQKSYNKLHNAAKDIDPECPTCVAQFYSSGKSDLDEVEANFNLNKSNKDVLKAFAQESYAKFLDQLLVPKDCLRASRSVQFENLQKVAVQMYPAPSPGKKVKGNYTEALAHIKEALKDGRPLSLGNLCLDQKPSESKCENTHGVVISGYRKVCNSKNECYDAIKVVNSWGQAWQDANNQGWLDAKTLLDRTFYSEATLSWFTDRK